MLLILGALIASVLLFLVYIKAKSWRYWEKRGFPTAKSHFLFGTCADGFTGKRHLAECFRDLHFEFKRRGCKVGGIYLLNMPTLLVCDNILMKHMLQTDFDYFTDRGFETGDKDDPLQDHMFNLEGEQWKLLRRKLSPTFTSGKMKSMFPIVENHIDKLCDVVKAECRNGQHDFLFYEYLERCGIDIIGHVAFGLDCNSIQNGDGQFYHMSKKIFNPDTWILIKYMLTSGYNNPNKIVKALTADKAMCDFFIKTVQDTVAYRTKNNVKAKDFLQLLIDVVDEDGKGLKMMEMVAQSFLFFVAGFETSARSVGFTLYNLAKHRDVQEKLRSELMKNLQEENGQYSYNLIMENEYLDMVFKETLRLYPPVITLNRQCSKDYKIPGTDLVVPENTPVLFSSLGFQHDPDNFEDPLQFKPERFTKENESKIKQFTYIPFGDGPRFCIGKRFGYMQGKMEVAKIIEHFDVSLSPDKPEPTGFSAVTKNLLLTFDNHVYLRFNPIK